MTLDLDAVEDELAQLDNWDMGRDSTRPYVIRLLDRIPHMVARIRELETKLDLIRKAGVRGFE